MKEQDHSLKNLEIQLSSNKTAKAKRKTFHLGSDAKNRSQFPPELFKIFKKTLGLLQVTGEQTVDMVWLIRSGYTAFFPKGSVPEPKVRIDPVSAAPRNKKNKGKELGNYTKISNQPVVLGTIPLDSRLGKVNEHGELPKSYDIDNEHSAILARSLEHIIGKAEQGIYELVDEGQQPGYLVYKVKPLYTDPTNTVHAVQIPVNGVQHRYRIDLNQMVEIEQLKNRNNRKNARQQLINLLPNKPITTLEALKEFSEQKIILGKKEKKLCKLNYLVEVKFTKEDSYQNILISTDSEGNPSVSDVDGFDLMLPQKFWEIIAKKYRELNKISDFTADDAEKLFNGVILTTELENGFSTNLTNKQMGEKLIEQFKQKTISLSKAMHAFHFLLHVFHPDYKDKPYSKKISPETADELERLMNLPKRGVIKPIILVVLALLNWNIANNFSHLGDLGMHGFEVHNFVKPQPIEGVVSISYVNSTKKYQIGLANGAENLACLLKNFNPQMPLNMCANPLATPDWEILKKSLNNVQHINLQPDAGLKFYCVHTLTTATHSISARPASLFVSPRHLADSNFNRNATMPAFKTHFSHNKLNYSITDWENMPEAIFPVENKAAQYQDTSIVNNSIRANSSPKGTVRSSMSSISPGFFGWLWSCCCTFPQMEKVRGALSSGVETPHQKNLIFKWF